MRGEVKDCGHKRLFFGSGDFYIICEDCNMYWVSEEDDQHNQGSNINLSGERRVEPPSLPADEEQHF